MDQGERLATWRLRVGAALARPSPAAGDAYPVDAVHHLLALGVQRIPFGPEMGGEGLGMRGLVAILEDLAAVDGSLAAIVMGMYSANAFLAASASVEQRRTVLGPLLAGEGLAAVAVTEPDGGTDVAAIATTCQMRRDGTWRLNGRKAFISNTGHPLWRLTIVLASGPERGGHTVFLVPSDAPGLTVGSARATIGWRRVGVHDLALDGVSLPDACRLGEAGGGLRLALQAFERGRVAVAALATGLCRGAWQEAEAYARVRRTFGEPLVAHQAVADHLVDLWRLYTRGRLVTDQAAQTLDAGLDRGPWAALAKWEATDAAVHAARLSAQTLGGHGLLVGSRAAERWADAKTLEVVEGSTEVQALVLRRLLQRVGLPARPGEEGEGAAHADA